jgi:hypothetical protein
VFASRSSPTKKGAASTSLQLLWCCLFSLLDVSLPPPTPHTPSTLHHEAVSPRPRRNTKLERRPRPADTRSCPKLGARVSPRLSVVSPGPSHFLGIALHSLGPDASSASSNAGQPSRRHAALNNLSASLSHSFLPTRSSTSCLSLSSNSLGLSCTHLYYHQFFFLPGALVSALVFNHLAA